MIQDYKAGDSIIIGGAEYTILYFHKGTGSSPLTARLRGKHGGEREILKSELKADEPIVEKTIENIEPKIITEVTNNEESINTAPEIKEEVFLVKTYKKKSKKK